MVCCRCNRTGRCKNCMCAKRGQPCQSCLPKRLGNCVNSVQTQTPSQASALNCMLTSLSSVPTSSTSSRHSSFADMSHVRLSQSPGPSTIPQTPLLSNSPVNEPTLPCFTPLADPMFTWGQYDSAQFIHTLNATFVEAVHRSPNLFKVPYGKAGKFLL